MIKEENERSIKLRAFHRDKIGWPEVTKGIFEERMIAAGRRFDEPGMEIELKAHLHK
tara:strand:+ start:219 stop:389 length:171 start_codon:yes stop_codon:yes gene_type:complete